MTTSDGTAPDEPAAIGPSSWRSRLGTRAAEVRAIARGRRRTAPEPPRLGILCAVVAVVLLAIQVPNVVEAFSRPNVNGYGGVDYRLYMDATQRWLEGGPFYEPYQLAGPYPITAGDILYPPVALWLFVPFTFLPPVLWWLVPIGVTAWVVWRLRPGPFAWALMALCLASPATLVKLTTGNPVLWSVAALALGCLYRWPSVFVLLKPSLFPFALFGADRRSWWIALGAFGLLCLPFGAMWGDWLTTLANSVGGGIAYSIQEIPMLLLPLVAWYWRRSAAG